MKTPKLASALLILFAGGLLGQSAKSAPRVLSEPLRQASIPGLLHTWHRLWDNDYLVSWGSLDGWDASPDQPSVILYNRDGHIAREGTVWLRDAYRVTIDDAAVNKAGDLVVSGGSENQAGAIANYIALIGKNGHVDKVIRTTPFMPIYICAAEDGTVWSFGIDRDKDGKGIEESLRLRQFSFDKGQIGAMLDISTLNSAGWALDRGRYPGEISLRCNAKKLGLYNGASGEWLELEFSTNKLRVAKLSLLPPPKQMHIRGFAMTDSGDIFASLDDRSTTPARVGLFHLEFDKNGLGSWVPVRNTIASYLKGPIDMLLGADGTSLVYTRDFSGTAYWSTVTR